MADEIKEEINDTTFLEKKILGFTKQYDNILFEKKIKKLEDMNFEEYLKHYLKKEEKNKKKKKEKNKKLKKKKKSKRKKKSKNDDDDDEELKNDRKLNEIMEIDQ